MLNEAIKKIEAQQAKLGKSPAYWVGEQLKDMLRAEPWNADLVARDLDVPGLRRAKAQKQTELHGRKNRHPRCARMVGSVQCPQCYAERMDKQMLRHWKNAAIRLLATTNNRLCLMPAVTAMEK